ncbi:hypothetical protein AB4Z54_03250 [Streptomyces sp. MCAF7]
MIFLYVCLFVLIVAGCVALWGALALTGTDAPVLAAGSFQWASDKDKKSERTESPWSPLVREIRDLLCDLRDWLVYLLLLGPVRRKIGDIGDVFRKW